MYVVCVHLCVCVCAFHCWARRVRTVHGLLVYAIVHLHFSRERVRAFAHRALSFERVHEIAFLRLRARENSMRRTCVRACVRVQQNVPLLHLLGCCTAAAAANDQMFLVRILRGYVVCCEIAV